MKDSVINSESTICELRALAKSQLELLRLALYVMSQGPVQFQGEALSCSLTKPKIRAATLVAMAAGQSAHTVLRMSDLRGIPVRDMYPIARSAIESFINASLFVADEDEVSERAIRYASYASWKHTNRIVGSGIFTLKITSDPTLEETIATDFSEFSGKGKSTWTNLDVPSRIRRIGELAGKKAGSRLLAAYALVYSLSSEIIHGSTFGVSYFYGAHLKEHGQQNVEAFRDSTAQQVVDILVALLHALAGFLVAFFEIQEMKKPREEEQRLFDHLYQISTATPGGATAS